MRGEDTLHAMTPNITKKNKNLPDSLSWVWQLALVVLATQEAEAEEP
jgi:hypothetical protein